MLGLKLNHVSKGGAGYFIDIPLTQSVSGEPWDINGQMFLMTPLADAWYIITKISMSDKTMWMFHGVYYIQCFSLFHHKSVKIRKS